MVALFRIRGWPKRSTLSAPRRRPDGHWLLENSHAGAVHFRFEEPDGTLSRWNTLRALRVLRWYDASAPPGSPGQAS